MAVGGPTNNRQDERDLNGVQPRSNTTLNKATSSSITPIINPASNLRRNNLARQPDSGHDRDAVRRLSLMRLRMIVKPAGLAHALDGETSQTIHPGQAIVYAPAATGSPIVCGCATGVFFLSPNLAA